MRLVDNLRRKNYKGNLINFEKRRKEGAILSQIQQLQESCKGYNICPNPSFHVAFHHQQQLSEEQSYRISRVIEPPADSCPSSPKLYRSLTKRFSSLLLGSEVSSTLPSLEKSRNSPMGSCSSLNSEDGSSTPSLPTSGSPTIKCKEIEENNRIGRTGDLFKKIGDMKGTFHAKMGMIKVQNGRDLTEAEEIKNRWQDYTEERYKKDLNVPDNHDGVVTDLEPDILECEVKWALGCPSNNKASGGESIPGGLDESPVGIKIARRKMNLRYADDTTLMAESEEELKSLLMGVKEESAKVGLKRSIKKTKIMASSPITSWQIDGEEMENLPVSQPRTRPPVALPLPSSTSTERGTESRIIRVSMNSEHGSGNCYRSIVTNGLSLQITSQDRTTAVVQRALQKHNLEGDSPQSYQLLQLLGDGQELLIPDNANAFYAMKPTDLHDFLLCPKKGGTSSPGLGTIQPTTNPILSSTPTFKDCSRNALIATSGLLDSGAWEALSGQLTQSGTLPSQKRIVLWKGSSSPGIVGQ
ncbi:Ral guanine nucleotide dissociation stimulator-like 3 [Varanus komodoensis]|nr:Ral guanine nucleotide dissociation stimulator-like 3 [Varanus komodoensis]